MKTNENTITITKIEYNHMIAENAELKAKLEWMMAQFRLGRHHLFGASSEKSGYDHSQVDLFGEKETADMFNEAEATADTNVAEPELKKVEAHYRKSKRLVNGELPDNIPVQTVVHELPQDERICPECGETMHVMGHEIIRRELVLIPAHAEIREYVQEVYGCRPCEKDADDMPVPVVKSPTLEPVIKGSFASPEAIAQIMCQKFVMGAPLYRQEQDWNRQGIMLSRQTMSNWFIRATETWLEPIYDKLHEIFLDHTTIHSDDTTVQVLHEQDKSPQSMSYMWLYRTSGYDLDGEKISHPIVLYEYQPSRQKKHPEKFLEGFKGYLHVDGYVGYHCLPDDIVIVGCWAHVRRKFDEALKAILPKDREGVNGVKAETGKKYCDELFRLERKFADMPPAERFENRQIFSKPLVDEFYAWLNSLTVLPKTLLGTAVNYALGQRKYLENYLLDGRLEISNNRAERSIKPFVIDRKNFLFSNTAQGAKVSAIIFSIIETAKENSLNPFAYLTYIFQNAPNWDIRNDPKMLELLLPASAPEICRISTREPK